MLCGGSILRLPIAALAATNAVAASPGALSRGGSEAWSHRSTFQFGRPPAS
jgi:hypothetical protein